MKRFLSVLCVLAMLLSIVPVAAFAAAQDLQALIDAGADEPIVLEADASGITVTRDTYVDLNGHDINGVTVLSGTLYCLDSQTADYTVADGVYGKVTNATGAVKAAEGYLQVGESFHAVNLDIYAMTLRAADVGVYYKSRFAADEIVAAEVESFGVALSVVTAPNASNLDSYCGYSVFEGFEAGEGANSVGTSTLLKGIMKASNGDNKNAKNASMPVYGRAYIKTADGYFFGETVKRSLQEQVEAIDKIWNSLTDSQKTPVLGLLESYTSVMESWNIPNIMGIQVPGAEGEIEIDVPVNAENGTVTEAVTVEQAGVSVTVPAGTKLSEGAEKLTLTVTPKEVSDAGLTLEESEVLMPMDVHVDGLAADNAAPLTIYLGQVMPENLNMGNYAVYHVENGKANEMTLIGANEEFTAHNQYKYTLDGELTLYMATFSEAAVVYNSTNAWNGDRTYDWYTENPNADTFYIHNADELAGFGAIVGGMANKNNDPELTENIAQNSFENKTVKLLADISIGDLSDEGEGAGKVFYPIGYYNSEYIYAKDSNATAGVSSAFKNFKGTFDGNGHTISDFYQNTWEMKGDHDWYDAKLQYYRDGMGLFGKVYGGTVKNLTVRNFKSDGEITTTGVIAAYADCGATFENIAIFDCNPRVYNIGNGGIVGCVGWYSHGDIEKAKDPVTFRNITVDNSNKISALWGSYDVPCGGIVGQYYPTSGQSSSGYPVNAGIHFDNCHVSAQMDVYNDVCANYQYYAYRYAGILLGSVRENVTDAETGYVYPKMDKITAKKCTVHFGDWNDYYYCELVANSLASYTHDHQMSRLEQVTSVDAANMEYVPLGETESVKIPTSGRVNYVVVKAKDNNGMWIHGDGHDYAACYHFVNGVQHFHDVADSDNPNPTETANGVEGVLKEDKQLVYREFNNLVTGYGWGVTSKGVDDMDGVTILDRQEANSVEKFGKADTAKDSYTTGATVTIGELFKATAAGSDEKTAIITENVMVAVSPVGDSSTAGGTYTKATEDKNRDGVTDWKDGALTFTGVGDATITITDYYFCTPTVLNVTITKREAEEKFDIVFPNTATYLYRVGNEVDVKLSSLFAKKDGAEIGTVSVTVEALNGTAASGDYTPNATWSNGTINFNETGIVKVTIQDDDEYCKPTTLFLEVVNAKNATSAASATTNNVVLLNDMTFNTITVSNGCYLYGNGFKMTATNDVRNTSVASAFVTLSSGTLDNVQIIVPNYSHAVLYHSNISESANQNSYDSNTKKYGNVSSAVMASGNSEILNSYISGGRAAIYETTSSNLLIANSTIVGGAAANIHVVAAALSLTLRDVTLIQKPIKATVYDTSKMLMGLSVLMFTGDDKYGAKLNLEGYLNQYAWAHEGYTSYVPSQGQSFVSTVLEEEDYIHQIEYADGIHDSLNLGIAYMPADPTTAPADPTTNISDERIDGKSYGVVSVRSLAYVYSYQNTNGTDTAVKTEPGYKANAQEPSLPTVSYSGEQGTEGLTFKTEYINENGWTSTLTVDVDTTGAYSFSFKDLLAQKYGNSLEYTVTDANGNAVDKNNPIVINDSSTTKYILNIVENQIYDKKGELTGNVIKRTHTFMLLSTKTSIAAPEWVSKTLTGNPLKMSSSSSSTDWNVAVPVLEGLKVKYYSKAQSKDVELALGDIAFNKGKQAETNSVTKTVDGEYTLKVSTAENCFHNGKQDGGLPTYAGGTLYFSPSSTDSLVKSTTSTSRGITIYYEFSDANNPDIVLKHTFTWTVNYSDVQSQKNHNIEKLLAGEVSTEFCVAAGSLITLADGTQVKVEDLTGTEELLVWNLETGSYDSAPIVFVDSDAETEYEIVHLYFADGTDVEVIYEHGFFDVDFGEYVYLDKYNAADYIGHSFIKQGDIANGTWETVELTEVVIEKKVTTAYSPVTFSHLCYYVDGMLSMPGGIDGLFNIFEVDTDTMAYDAEKKAADIETYGLYTYEDFADMIPEEAFYAFNGAYLKVAIAKGLLTWEDIAYLAERYVPLM